MIITAIEPQERRARANIFLDGQFGFALSLELIELRGLAPGRSVTPAEATALQNEELRRRIADSAWRLLSYRPRARQELRQRLLRKGYPADAVDAGLQHLIELGYLDDPQFARSLVEVRQSGGSPRGRVALRGELRRKGVDDETSEAALADLDEFAGARRAAEKRMRSLHTVDYADFRRRLVPFLQRRGFSYDAIKSTLDTLWQEQDGAEPQDADPLPDDYTSP
jgi:regulatory protein